MNWWWRKILVMSLLNFFFCTSISDNTKCSEMNPGEWTKANKIYSVKIFCREKGPTKGFLKFDFLGKHYCDSGLTGPSDLGFKTSPLMSYFCCQKANCTTKSAFSAELDFSNLNLAIKVWFRKSKLTVSNMLRETKN